MSFLTVASASGIANDHQPTPNVTSSKIERITARMMKVRVIVLVGSIIFDLLSFYVKRLGEVLRIAGCLRVGMSIRPENRLVATKSSKWTPGDFEGQIGAVAQVGKALPPVPTPTLVSIEARDHKMRGLW